MLTSHISIRTTMLPITEVSIHIGKYSGKKKMIK